MSERFKVTKSEEMKSGSYKNYGATGAQQGSPSEGSGAGGSGEASGALGRLLPGEIGDKNAKWFLNC